MSLISRLRAVVAGDDYLDGELDDFAYDDEQDDQDQRALQADGGALATIGDSNPFDLGGDLPGSNVIGMPGISNAVSEVNVMEPRSFDEMPRAIQALRERKTVILNLTMMEPDQAQRAVDFVAGGTFAIAIAKVPPATKSTARWAWSGSIIVRLRITVLRSRSA